MALTASTPSGLRASLKELVQGAASVGLEIGLPKCATLYSRGDGKRKRWLVYTKTTIEIGGAKLRSIQKAPGKPQQKLWALKNVVIPKHQYSRVLGKATTGSLHRMDCEVRKYIKKALYLPKDIPNAGTYTRTYEGG